MSIRLEERKLAIIERLAETADENIILQIENLLQPKVDIWDELSEEEKSLIVKGLKDLDEGRRFSFDEALRKFRASEK